MLVSRKGRYSVRALVALLVIQETLEGKPVKLSLVAETEKLPLYYIEQLFNKLRRGGIVRSVKGPGGGYLVNMAPEELSLLDVLVAVGELDEESDCDKNERQNAGCVNCSSRSFWDKIDSRFKEYLDSIKIIELVKKSTGERDEEDLSRS